MAAPAAPVAPLPPPPAQLYAPPSGLQLCLGGHTVLRPGPGNTVVKYAVVASAAPNHASPTACEIDRRWKRYSDFDRLASALQPAQKLLGLPPLPGKEWSLFTPPDSEALIRKRIAGLDAWLGALATALNQDWIPPFARRVSLEWLAQDVGLGPEGGKVQNTWSGASQQQQQQPASVVQQQPPVPPATQPVYTGQLHILGLTTPAPVIQTSGGGDSISVTQLTAQKQAQAAADARYFASLTPEQREGHVRGLELLSRLTSLQGWCFVNDATGVAEWWQFDLRERMVERRFGSPGASKHKTHYRFAGPPTIRLAEYIVEIELKTAAPDRVLLRMVAPQPRQAADSSFNELLPEAEGAAPQKRTLTVSFVGCGLFFLGFAGLSDAPLNRPLTPDEHLCAQRTENERTYVEAGIPAPLVIHFRPAI